MVLLLSPHVDSVSLCISTLDLYKDVCVCSGGAVRSGVCHINSELERQMFPLLLLCDIPIHFDAGPSSVHENIKHTHTHTLLQTAGP